MTSRLPVTAALLVGLGALALYASTLLPGLDLGDTASFQVMAGNAAITPRDGYPLYFAIGGLFAALDPANPAHALNLASAAAAAVACALLVMVGFELSGSVLAAVVAAVVFGGSYTFWSQSVIAEVYALHMCLIAATLLLLLRWQRRPDRRRLALFLTVYALAFGNHLSTVLLLPGYALFLLIACPGGWRAMLSRRNVVLAVVIAAAAALQYGWNLHTLWAAAQPPAGFVDALRAFWFDVTKSDWRDTMVLEVPTSVALERLRMYGFDLAQQFGWLFPCLAVLGLYRLARRDWRQATLIALVYVVNVGFALGYNVGDSHVFFLPSHLMVALLVAPGLMHLDRLAFSRGAVPLAALALAGVHLYQEYPALDRSGDTRPQQVLEALTGGLDERKALLFTGLNWQLENGLTYYARKVRTDLAVARLSGVLLYAPALFDDNFAIGRDILVTDDAAVQLQASYGPLYSSAVDERAPVPDLSQRLRALPKGTRYVLTVLQPTREFPIDEPDLLESLRLLTGGGSTVVPQQDYVAIAGIVGDGPAAVIARERPFRESIDLDGVRVLIRMESWLPFDTIRRMGFGQVIAARQHTLIVERGVSFAAFDDNGRPIQTDYRGNIFEPQRRWHIRRR